MAKQLHISLIDDEALFYLNQMKNVRIWEFFNICFLLKRNQYHHENISRLQSLIVEVLEPRDLLFSDYAGIYLSTHILQLIKIPNLLSQKTLNALKEKCTYFISSQQQNTETHITLSSILLQVTKQLQVWEFFDLYSLITQNQLNYHDIPRLQSLIVKVLEPENLFFSDDSGIYLSTDILHLLKIPNLLTLETLKKLEEKCIGLISSQKQGALEETTLSNILLQVNQLQDTHKSQKKMLPIPSVIPQNDVPGERKYPNLDPNNGSNITYATGVLESLARIPAPYAPSQGRW